MLHSKEKLNHQKPLHNHPGKLAVCCIVINKALFFPSVFLALVLWLIENGGDTKFSVSVSTYMVFTRGTRDKQQPLTLWSVQVSLFTTFMRLIQIDAPTYIIHNLIPVSLHRNA